jgi:hypothetical protein
MSRDDKLLQLAGARKHNIILPFWHPQTEEGEKGEKLRKEKLG